MTIGEIKAFAELYNQRLDKLAEQSAEKLNIVDNRLYLTDIKLGLYDGRSTGHENSLVLSGVLVLVDEEQVLTFVAEQKYPEDDLQAIMKFFYERNYVAFAFEAAMMDETVTAFMQYLQDKYTFKYTFILSGTAEVQDEERETTIKSRLQYAGDFEVIYPMLKELFRFSLFDGNTRDFASNAFLCASKNVFKSNLVVYAKGELFLNVGGQ